MREHRDTDITPTSVERIKRAGGLRRWSNEEAFHAWQAFRAAIDAPARVRVWSSDQQNLS